MRDGPVEPTVEELLRDPIAQMLMARDGLSRELVWSCIRDALAKLRAHAAAKARAETAPAPHQAAREHCR